MAVHGTMLICPPPRSERYSVSAVGTTDLLDRTSSVMPCHFQVGSRHVGVSEDLSLSGGSFLWCLNVKGTRTKYLLCPLMFHVRV